MGVASVRPIFHQGSRLGSVKNFFLLVSDEMRCKRTMLPFFILSWKFHVQVIWTG